MKFKRLYRILLILLLIFASTSIFWSYFATQGGEGASIRELSSKMIEDLKFKDLSPTPIYLHSFDRITSRHAEAIENWFQSKPEYLEIKDSEVGDPEFDEARRNARVTVNVRYRLLNQDMRPRTTELSLYWTKAHPECPMGGLCEKGICIDQRGDPIFPKPSDELKMLQNQPDPPERTGHSPPAKLKPYICSEEQPPKWFLNLNTTFADVSPCSDAPAADQPLDLSRED